MAITKLGATKSVSNSLSYAEKKAEVRSGLNCDIDIVKEQFKATRVIWGKDGGIQAHTIVQAFEPGETTPEQANEMGRELAERVAVGYEVAIYTHADKGHVHNHIIINSVHPDTGRKYHSSRDKFREVQLTNDEICKRYGLSIASDKAAKLRYTLAEQSILKKGKDSWKDEIRTAIDIEVRRSGGYEDLKKNLQDNYGIVVDDSRKHIVFTHPERTGEHDKGKVRGYTLGDDYTKEGLYNGIERYIRQNEGKELREGDIVRELITQNSPNRGERGKSPADPKIDRVRRGVNDITPAGRRETEAERRRFEEANKRTTERSSATTSQQPEICSEVKSRGLSLGR